MESSRVSKTQNPIIISQRMNPITQSERSLIGCLINCCDESSVIAVREAGITPDSFNDYALGQIFGAVCTGMRPGFVPDIGTLTYALEPRIVDAIGGVQGLNRLIDEACISAHAGYHARIIYQAALARRSSHSLSKWSKVMAESKEPEIDLAQAQSELAELQISGLTKSPVRHISDFRHEKIEQWRAAKGKGYIGIPSSFHEINQYLGGYRHGVMLVLGGFRGEGKSTLARQEAFGIAQKGYKTLICSLEDPGDIAAAGIAGNYANRSVFHLDTGSDDIEHINQMDREWADLAGVPLHIASGAMRIEDIETAAMIHKARHGLDFIVIDHIQFITPYKLPGMDRNGTVATYSQRIVSMLTKHKIPGLILSQLSRDSEKESRKPRLSDLRDSGCIEQDARAVMLLYYNGGDKHHRLEIAKNNFGISGKTFKIKREDGRQRFAMIGEEV